MGCVAVVPDSLVAVPDGIVVVPRGVDAVPRGVDAVPGGVDAVPGGIDAGGVQAVALQPAIGTAVHSHTGHRWREILIPGNNKN